MNVLQKHKPDIGLRAPEKDDSDYWYTLINEDKGAEFVDLDPRTLQARRQRGGGPKYVRISSRCIKYRRIDLKEWADGLLRQSTSDTGETA